MKLSAFEKALRKEGLRFIVGCDEAGRGALAGPVVAGAVVLENTHVEANSIYAGVPARKVKVVDGKRDYVFERTVKNYIMYADWYREIEK